MDIGLTQEKTRRVRHRSALDRSGVLLFPAVIWLSLLCVPVVLQAQGGYADALLRLGVGSRSEAMGRAYTAVVGDPESAYFNPAATTAMHSRMVDLSIRALPLDRRFVYIGFSTALQPGAKSVNGRRPTGGGLALSYIHAGVSNIDGRDSDGEKFGSFSNTQHLVNFSFALLPWPWLSVGVTGRLFWNRFPKLGEGEATIGSRAVGLDFGVLGVPLDGVWLGAVIKNINAKYTWDSSSLYERGTSTTDRFPKMWRLGVATSRLREGVLLALDVEGSDKQDPRVYAGTAIAFLQHAHIRLGLRAGDPTFGAAYYFRVGGRLSALHYAFVLRPDEVSPEHIFSWSFVF